MRVKTETAELDAVIPRDLALHGSSAPAAPPTDREKREIEAARSRIADRRRPVRTKVQSKRYGSRTFVSTHADAAGFRTRLADALGSVSPDFLEASLHQLIQVASHCDCAEGGAELELNASLALVQSVRPTNELEAALALQLAATHRLAMETMGRLRRGMTRSNADVYGRLSTRLLHAFAAQVEALEKLRRGGKQVVRIERVTLGEGAQAIIGTVNHGTGQGGGA
jgi:hypothetical protein